MPSPLDRSMPHPERGSELTAAITAAGSGATIELKQGTYTGAFVISSKTNLTIKPKPGAHVVLTNRDPRFAVANSLWTHDGDGIYSIDEVLGSSIYHMNGDRILYAKDADHFAVLIADGIDTALRGETDTQIYLNGANPNQTPLYISDGDSAVLDATSSPGLTLQKLDIRFGGAQAIDLDGCDDVLVEECTIYGGTTGIRNRNAVGENVTVRRCWLVNHYDRKWWYRDVKGNSLIEGAGLVIPGLNPVMEENIITGWFNGLACNAATDTTDCIVRYNLIEDVADDAIEMDGPVIRGEIYENLVLDAFVVFSFAPREVGVPAEDTLIHHNSVQGTRNQKFDRTLGACSGPPDFTGAGCGFASGTKFNPGAPSDLLFEFNTFVCYQHAFRGAPSGGDYPINVRCFDNVFVTETGPTIRNTGVADDGNDWNRNVYFGPTSNIIQNWAIAPGTTTNAATLAAAKASAGGVASGWEADGIQADPRFVIPGVPSSLRRGSQAEGKGAWERTPMRVDSITELATGWLLVRGTGFESAGDGLNVIDPIVVSNTTAFARERCRAPVSRRAW
jgi:hypothetical protein